MFQRNFTKASNRFIW